MKKLTINVPDMQSTHCQASVRNAVMTIEGLEIRHLEAGRISVSLEADHLEDDVVKTIEKAGYAAAIKVDDN
jgi:copper chaperone CopZ